MERRRISFSPPDITDLEIAEVAETLRSGWITTGPRVKLLERRLAAFKSVSEYIRSLVADEEPKKQAE